MKKVIVILILLNSFIANATTYYFANSSSGGNDGNSGTSSGSPWQSASKFTSTVSTASSGDIILFNRGNVFTGFTVTACASGVTFGAYGTGAKPVISGFTSLSSWTETSPGSTLWVASCNSGASLDLVTVNGVITPMGRTPNKGSYYTVNYHDDLTGFSGLKTGSLSSDAVNSAINYTGAELVLKPRDWCIDRDLITGQSGTTLSFNSSSDNGIGSTSYTYHSTGPKFFLQHHISTLDQQNEWYYDASAHTITMKSSSDPGPLNVMAATQSHAFNYGYSSLTIQDLKFTGQDSLAILIVSGNGVTITNCDFDQIGNDAISVESSSNINVESCNFSNLGNSGIVSRHSSNVKAIGNNILKAGVIEGMGLSNNQQRDGIMFETMSDSTVIKFNNIDSTGYCGIRFTGINSVVQKNSVNHFGLQVSDGGGIYTNGENGFVPYRLITDNVVQNGYGNHSMSEDTAHGGEPGIYLDDASGNVTIQGNTVSNATRYGIFLHNSHEINIWDNTIIGTNGDGAIGVVHDGLEPLHPTRNLNIKHNLINSPAGLNILDISSTTNDIDSIGVIDSNYYSRTGSGNIVRYQYGSSAETLYSLASWASTYHHDAASTFQVITSDSLRFEVDPTSAASTTSLGAYYKDLKGTTYTGSITLQPYSSAILKKTSGSSAVAATPVYRINAGGGAVTNSIGTFAADAFYLPGSGYTGSTSSNIYRTADTTIYKSERYGSDGTLDYAFPLANGDYTVVLHFTEFYLTGTGQRIFDVLAEGSTVLHNYDILKHAAPNTATTQTFTTTVTDGVLNLHFTSLTDSGSNQPKISAIEVLMKPSALYRINTGGGAVINSIGAFAADAYYGSDTSYANAGSNVIHGTADTAIYQSERYPIHGILKYAFPVNKGQYTVVLHFAEIYHNAAGQRVFDVKLEGNTVLSQFDIFNEVGANTADVKRFLVTVADDTLNIDFSSLNTGGSDQPKISAIEILNATPAYYRVNTTGGTLTTSMGIFYPDTAYTHTGYTGSTTLSISGTRPSDTLLYKSERYGSDNTLHYAFPVSNGDYNVRLHFAEFYVTAVGQRIFDVSMEGTTVLDNYDIIQQAGGALKAKIETIPVTVTDGVLNIDFNSASGVGGTNQPKISGIEVLAKSTSPALRVVNSGSPNIAPPIPDSKAAIGKFQVKVLPNPATNHFQLKVTNIQNAAVSIRIFNNAGRLMEIRENVPANELIQFGDNYPAGIYYSQIFNGSDMVTLKLIKQSK